jgi:hypothetical protein
MPWRNASLNLDLVLRAHGADGAHYSMPVAPSDCNAVGDIEDLRIIGELRAVIANGGEVLRSRGIDRGGTRGRATSASPPSRT